MESSTAGPSLLAQPAALLASVSRGLWAAAVSSATPSTSSIPSHYTPHVQSVCVGQELASCRPSGYVVLVFFRFLVALLAVSASLALSAQSSPPAPERRTIAVSVLDKEGKAVRGLTAENFRGQFRGQPVRILSATEDSSPRRIALIVDIRGPWVGRLWEVVWKAAEDVVRRVTPRHAVAVLAAGGGRQQRAEFVTDPDALLARLRELQVEARTAGPTNGANLREVITDGASGFSPVGFGDVFYVITPAVGTYYNPGHPIIASTEGKQTTKAELGRAGLRLFVLWVGDVPRPGPLGWTTPTQARPSDLEDVVDTSGGRLEMVLRQHEPDDLPSLGRPLYEAIAHVYQVEVDFPAAIQKPGGWKLEVVGDDGKKLKGVEVAYPRLLVPLNSK